jgi:GT2 family glycosyltransferase
MLVEQQSQNTTTALSEVTVAIFTKNVASANYQKCISRLPEEVRKLVIQGAYIFYENQFREHRYVIHPSLYGRSFNFARNCNVSRDYAFTDWILYLNDDCFLNNGDIEEMLSLAEETGASIVGGNITNVYYGKTLLQNDDLEIRFSDTDFAVGACMLVKKDLPQRWDENFTLSYEDNDFCLQVKKSGRRVILAHRVRPTHFAGSSSRSLEANIEKARSTFYFQRKWESLNLKVVLYRLFYGPTFPVRSFLLSKAFPVARSFKRLRSKLFPSFDVNFR